MQEHLPWRFLIGSILFFFCLSIYSGVSTPLPFGDAAPSLYLAKKWGLGVDGVSPFFTPERDPFGFKWRAKLLNGKVANGGFTDWNQKKFDLSFRDLRSSGRLVWIEERYFLVPGTTPGVFASTFGVVPPLVAAPFVRMIHWFFPQAFETEQSSLVALRWVSACLISGAVLFLFLTCALFAPLGVSAFVALCYGFGSCAWSISSQSLWQQTASAFFISVGLYFYFRDRRSRDWVISGGALAVAGANRVVNFALVFCLVIHSLAKRQPISKVIRIAIGLTPPLIAMGFYNFMAFSNPFVFAQSLRGHTEAMAKTGSADLWQTGLWEGLAGLLASPGRGLFFYSPIYLLAIPGVILIFRDQNWKSLKPLVFVSLVSLLIASKWFDWWGGWTYGYRPLVDSLPVLSLLILPYVKKISQTRNGRVGLALLFTYSVGVQVVGTLAYDELNWNARILAQIDDGRKSAVRFMPNYEYAGLSVDQKKTLKILRQNIDLPEFRFRLWEFQDSPIWFYIKNFAMGKRQKEFALQMLESRNTE